MNSEMKNQKIDPKVQNGPSLRGLKTGHRQNFGSYGKNGFAGHVSFGKHQSFIPACNSTTVRGEMARLGRTGVRFPEKLKCQTFEWKTDLADIMSTNHHHLWKFLRGAYSRFQTFSKIDLLALISIPPDPPGLSHGRDGHQSHQENFHPGHRSGTLLYMILRLDDQQREPMDNTKVI